MATEWTQPMGWDATGTAPSEELAEIGFKAGDKPPASVFNYFLNTTGTCISELQEKVDGINPVYIVNASSTDGVTYTATNEKIGELKTGTMIVLIPNMTSTSQSVKLNLNGTGDIKVYQSSSSHSSVMMSPSQTNWLSEQRAVLMVYQETTNTVGTVTKIWKTIATRANATDFYGVLAVEKGGTGNTSVDTVPTSGSTKMVTSEGIYNSLPFSYTGTVSGAQIPANSTSTQTCLMIESTKSADDIIAVSFETSYGTLMGVKGGSATAIPVQGVNGFKVINGTVNIYKPSSTHIVMMGFPSLTVTDLSTGTTTTPTSITTLTSVTIHFK